ncbi:MAG: M13 family metallopeptidase [Acidobacteriales bacterium]|nr:M13 family metallopeptidase [Candidatus Koribacter versatilis]MBI3644828.1 M13 family metallopeptidase [Terriglobales bacterium]
MFLKKFALFPAALILIFPLPLSAQNAPDQPVLDLAAMDKTVDPCVDFYTYSCGGWMKNNPVPPDQSSWGTYGKLQDDNLAQLRTILEEAARANAEKGAVPQKIGDYYASCMDEPAIEKLGAAPLTPELERIAHLKSKKALAEYLATSQFPTSIYGGGSLFTFRSTQDFKNSAEVIAEADQGGLGLPDRDYYFKDDAKSQELRKAYLAHVQKMFELLGDKPEQAAAEAATVMRIETALAKSHMTRVERRDPQKLYHRLSVKELGNLSPRFGWNAYLAKSGLISIESLNVVTPDYFRTMSATIKKESLPDWKTYLRWHAAHNAATNLSSAFNQETFNFYGKTLRGQEQLPPRWKRCTNDVDNDLGEALGQAYVARYFSPEAKQAAVNMVKEIEAAMQSEIQALPWMGAATKQQALTKLESIANKVGYPDKWRDYSALDIVRGDEMGNAQRAAWFEFHRWLAKIGRPVDHAEWTMTPPTVNAYYDPQKNDINFPAGILQPPLFSAKSDAAPNYGNTGGTMGHELTHAFDDEGSQFDDKGNLRNWWTDEDRKAFEQRAQCVVDQYSGYTIVDDIKINGKLTNGEDIADIGGTLLAYLAWKEDTRNQKLEPSDGLTPEQRFFIGYGQSWCTNEREENKRLRATVDPHSPEKYRTNGVVSNLPEFREAFHCKAGQLMVREKVCRVW